MRLKTLPFLQAALIIGTQFLDYKTTAIGLGLGARELNGPVRAIIDNYGLEGLLYVKLGLGALAAWTLRYRPVAAAVLSGMFLAAGVYNLFVIQALLTAA